jgi:hypothetical protein
MINIAEVLWPARQFTSGDQIDVGPRLSDAGLVHLKGLTNLSYLQLDGTQVTDAGVKELTRALPSLRIMR